MALESFFLSYVSLPIFLVGVFVIATRQGDSGYAEWVGRLVTFCLFFLVFGLRSVDSGVDTFGYRNSFDSGLVGEDVSSDLGFQIVADFVSLFSKDSKVFVLVLFLMQYAILICACATLKIRSLAYYLVVFILFLPGFDLFSNTVRQGVSVAFGFLAIALILRRRFVASFPVLVLACGLHSSAFMYFLLYPLLFSTRRALHFGFYAIPVVFFSTNYVDLSLASFLNSLGLPGLLGDLVAKLYNYESYVDGRMSGSIKLYLFLVFYLPLVGVFSFLYKDKPFEAFDVVLGFYVLVLLVYAVISKGTFSFRLLYLIYPVCVLFICCLVERMSFGWRTGLSMYVIGSGVLVLNATHMGAYKVLID